MHPTTKILALIFLGIMLNKLGSGVLIIMLCLMMLLASYWRANVWVKMLLRMRWLFLSMFLVYGLATPGEYVPWMPIDFGFTYEGLSAGVLQIMRLILMLGGIALLMTTTTQNKLIAGFYVLLKPLNLLQLKPERFAARLCLTLQYLEDGEMAKRKSGGESIRSLLQSLHLSDVAKYETQIITLELPNFNVVDFVVFVGILMLVLIR
jgi:energy-coupling factor transporter transmembrane protein EcfT